MTTYNRKLTSFKLSVTESQILHFYATKLRIAAVEHRLNDYPPETQTIVVAGNCTGVIQEIERYAEFIKNARKDNVVLKLRSAELSAAIHCMACAEFMIKCDRVREDDFDMDCQDLQDTVLGMKMRMERLQSET